MIDTVKLTHTDARMTVPDIEAIGARRSYRRGLPQWFLSAGNESGQPLISFTELPTAAVQIAVEASIPRFRNGSNAALLSQSETLESLRDLCDFVSYTIDRSFRFETALVSRVDYAADWLADSEITAHRLISQIGRQRVPRMMTHIINDTTVYFNQIGKRKDYSIRVYSKSTEIRSKSGAKEHQQVPTGTIRFECSLMSPSRIKQVLKSRGFEKLKRSVLILSPEVSNEVISELWKSLNFPSQSISEAELIDKLLGVHGPRKVLQHLGYISAVSALGPDFYKNSPLRLSTAQNYRFQRELRMANIDIYGNPKR